MRYNLPAKLACQVGRGKKRNHSGAMVRLFNLSAVGVSQAGAVSVQKNESKSVSYCCATPKLLVLAFPEAIAVVTLVRTRSPPYL